jgi:hypothetical protein
MTIRTITLLFCVSLLLLATPEARAQARFKDVTVGSWTIRENTDGALDDETVPSKKPTGKPNTAYTLPVDGRKAELSFDCSAYELIFSFQVVDQDFIDAMGASIHSENDIYTKVDAEELRRTILAGGIIDYFQTFPLSRLTRGANFMICPKRDDADPACLAFSLKGFTAALKAVCPKR